MQQAFQCYRCNAQNYVGQPYCWNCQSPFQWNCPNCKAPVHNTMASCPYCHVLLPWSSQQQIVPINNSREQVDIKKPKKKTKPWLVGCSIVAGVVILVAVLLFIGGILVVTPPGSSSKTAANINTTMTLAEIKNKATTIPWDDLMRNNEKYVGQIVYYRGKLVQVANNSGNDYSLRLATKKTQYFGYSDDIVWINYEGTRLLENDIVDVWGTVKGLKSYSALFGNQVTIPEIDSASVELVTKAAE